MEDIKVSVVCCVYNHERYLRKCLESLTSQQTNFRYEVIVHDDASTDRSAEIIREFEEKFPNIIVPIYQVENQYSQGNNPALIVLKQARGEYIAICEGDDFWTSEHKLQTQADFLDENLDYSMCAHASYYAHEDGSLYSDMFFRPFDSSREVMIQEVLDGWNFATNSLVYRKVARKELIIPFRGDCPNGDYALAVYLALNGKVYYIDELMSAYRKESVGSLNWVWKEDHTKFIEAREKFISMLKRINQYTNYQFSDVLERNIEKYEFSLCMMKGNLKEAKTHTKMYHDLGIWKKCGLWVHHYCPVAFYFCKRMGIKIKQ